MTKTDQVGGISENKPVRLGIIGAGVAATLLHWPALSQMRDRYTVVAVANRGRHKAEEFASLAGLDASHVYTDYRELLARGDLDAVLLALPTHLNYEVARSAAQAGVHIICEKPIAPTLAAGQAMLALAGEFGIKLLVAENFRYDAAVQQARQLLDSGQIASPFMLSYKYVQPVPEDDVIANTSWRQENDYVAGGGFLIDHGVHMIDVVRYLMGEISAVHVFGKSLKEHVAGFDTAVFNLRFDSGAVGSIQWSFSVASPQVSKIQLWSEDGTITIGADTVLVQRPGSADEVHSCPPYRSFVNEYADFYEALVHDGRPHMTPLDAWKDLEAVLAAQRSAISQQAISLGSEVAS